MGKEIEAFITALSHIGSRDDSLYDTLIRDSILEIIIRQPLARELAVSDAIRLSNCEETENLYVALRSLLIAFERSAARESLESTIKHHVLTLPPNSSQRRMVDEIFGDYFDESIDGIRQLPAPIRNFFYSDRCYLTFMAVPALIVGGLMFTVYPQAYKTLFLLVAMTACLAAAIGGACLHEYLNTRIQRYERKDQTRST